MTHPMSKSCSTDRERGRKRYKAEGGTVDTTQLPPPVPMPTITTPDTGDKIEGTPSESNKPSFLRGKKGI